MLVTGMTEAYAAAAPYECYEMTGADPAFLADPASGYFALTGDGTLIGFRSFGADGQVPGGAYDAAALDTGGGLRPELTGRGLGREAISTGLDFGRRQFAPPAPSRSATLVRRPDLWLHSRRPTPSSLAASTPRSRTG